MGRERRGSAEPRERAGRRPPAMPAPVAHGIPTRDLLLRLQRSAGNQAVAGVMRAGGGGSGGGGSGASTVRTTEIATLVLQMMQRGQTPSADQFPERERVGVMQVHESLLAASKAVLYWLRCGCVRRTGQDYELVVPCPALAIAGWVPNPFVGSASLWGNGLSTLAPASPDFLPTVDAIMPGRGAGSAVRMAEASASGSGPSASGGSPAPSGGPGGGSGSGSTPSQSGGSARSERPFRGVADPALRTAEALPVATHVLMNHIQHQPHLARGLQTPQQQRLAMKVVGLMLRYLDQVTYMSSYGVASPRGWTRPAPPEKIARLLGVGPSDDSDLRGWGGH